MPSSVLPQGLCQAAPLPSVLTLTFMWLFSQQRSHLTGALGTPPEPASWLNVPSPPLASQGYPTTPTSMMAFLIFLPHHLCHQSPPKPCTPCEPAD